MGRSQITQRLPSSEAQASSTDNNNEETVAMDASNNNEQLRGLKWVNLSAFALNVAVTYGIGVAGLFGLPTNSELSEKYQTVVTPIGWAFSIWALIFTAQAVWVLQQFCRVSDTAVEHIAAVKCNYLFVVLAQVAWTLTFSSEYIAVSLGMMVLILWNLFVIVRSLANIHKVGDEPRSSGSALGACTNYFLLEFPFAIHFGWILAATVVNANVVLVSEGLGSSIQFFGAVGGLGFLVLAAVTLILAGYLTAPIVVVWALFGVYKEVGSPKDSIVETFSASQLETIQYGAVGAMTFILIAVAVKGIQQLRAASSMTNSEESVYLRANDT